MSEMRGTVKLPSGGLTSSVRRPGATRELSQTQKRMSLLPNARTCTLVQVPPPSPPNRPCVAFAMLNGMALLPHLCS